MKKKHRFYLCEHCGNLVGMIHDAGVPIICCSEPMKELVANTSDAAQEKHVPVVEVEGKHVKVKVGMSLTPRRRTIISAGCICRPKKAASAKLWIMTRRRKPSFVLLKMTNRSTSLPTATCTDCGKKSCKQKSLQIAGFFAGYEKRQ